MDAYRYIMGDAAQFTGSDLMVEAQNEIVLVIIQYRLGLFGSYILPPQA
jgi:carboxylesterase type B